MPNRVICGNPPVSANPPRAGFSEVRFRPIFTGLRQPTARWLRSDQSGHAGCLRRPSRADVRRAPDNSVRSVARGCLKMSL